MIQSKPCRIRSKGFSLAMAAGALLLAAGCAGSKQAKVVAYDISLFMEDTVPTVEKLKNNDKIIVNNYNAIAGVGNSILKRELLNTGVLLCERQYERSRRSLYEQQGALVEDLQSFTVTFLAGLEDAAKTKLKPQTDRIAELQSEKASIENSSAASDIGRIEKIDDDLRQLYLIVNASGLEAILTGIDTAKGSLAESITQIKQKAAGELTAVNNAVSRCKAEAKTKATSLEPLFITDLENNGEGHDALIANIKALSASGEQLVRQQTFASLDADGAARRFGKTTAISFFHAALGKKAKAASAEDQVIEAEAVSTADLTSAFNDAKEQLLSDLAASIPFVNLASVVNVETLKDKIRSDTDDAIKETSTSPDAK